MGFQRRVAEAPRVDLTPMIDVVFLLLIFFMISTTFVETPGLKIDLPESSVYKLDQHEKEVQLYLTAEGEIFYQRQPISLPEIAQKLTEFGASAKHTTFLLMADRDALHGKVIQLMDLAKTAGFEKLAIATDNSTPKTD